MSGSNCNAIVDNGINLKLIATDKIVLRPGFHGEAGSNFYAKLVDCPGPQKSLSTNQKSDSTLQIISGITPENEEISSNVSPIIDNSTILYIKIYPNPTEGQITIEFVGNLQLNKKIEIINSLGEVVHLEDNISSNSIIIDISSLPKGVYILKGTFGLSSVSEKIVLK